MRPLAPRTFLAWSLAAIAVSVLTDSPVYRALVALSALAVLQAWLPSGRSLRGIGMAAAFAASLAFAMNMALGHTGVHVLARLPSDWPVVGGPITLEAAAFGGAVALGLVAALLAVAPLSLVLEPHEIVDAIPRQLQRTGIAVAASLNLVGGIGRTFAEVRDAQLMRGWKPRGVRSWNEVVVPVVLTAIEDSVLLAESMEARGFAQGPRTSFAATRFHGADLLVLATAAAVVVVFALSRPLGLATPWYPYPSLTMPSAHPLLALACVALALPALLSDRDGEA